VLGHQTLKKRPALVGRYSHQVGPHFLRARPARDNRFSIADSEHPAVEIEDVSVSANPLHGSVLAQLVGGHGIELRKAQGQTAQGWVAEKGVDKLATLLFLGGEPVICPV